MWNTCKLVICELYSLADTGILSDNR